MPSNCDDVLLRKISGPIQLFVLQQLDHCVLYVIWYTLRRFMILVSGFYPLQEHFFNISDYRMLSSSTRPILKKVCFFIECCNSLSDIQGT